MKNQFILQSKVISLYSFSLPLKKNIDFKGNKLNSREGIWLIQHNSSGQDFIGEASPLPGFSNETLQQSQQQLLTLLMASREDQRKYLSHPLYASTHFALFCLQQQIPWCTPPANGLINVPLLQGSQQDILIRYQLLKYPNIIKLKVAKRSMEEEVDLIHKMIQLNPAVRFRLDANQQWSALQYTAFLSLINTSHIDYIEEPTHSIKESIHISNKFNISIGLDESLLTNHPLPIANCIKALIIKPTLLGDPQYIAALLKHAQQHQLLVSISASFESPIALNQLQHLAVKWQQAYKIEIHLGLDTLNAFEDSILEASKQLSLSINPFLIQATALCHHQ